MKHTFKYILFSLALLVPVYGFAQDTPPIYASKPYNIENGIGTFKEVSTGMDDNGYYTLSLETFATGSSTVTHKSIPSDIVLVLDLSTSMGGHRGTVTRLSEPTQVSIKDIESTTSSYGVYRIGHHFAYQISVLETKVGNETRYYPYTQRSTYVYFFKNDGSIDNSSSGRIGYKDLYNNFNANSTPSFTINPGSNHIYATDKNTPFLTFPAASGDAPITNEPDPNFQELAQDWEIVKTGGSRIFELKAAVKAFIDEIVKNDRKTTVNGQLVDRPNGPLGNKLAIVTFGKEYLSKYSTALLSLTDTNIDALNKLVDGFTLYDGTKQSAGLAIAGPLLTGSDRTGSVGEDYLRTVVFFTDGQPEDEETNPQFDGPISAALVLKSAPCSAKVYSVGLFSLAVGSTEVAQSTQNFMNYTSSNYPEASSYANPGTPKDNTVDPTKYYQDVTVGDANLTTVFKAIAEASGGSERTVPGATQVVDGLTNSFTLPQPANGSAPTLESIQVRVYTRSINTAGTDWKKNDSGKYVENNLTVVEMPAADTQTPNPNAEYMTDDSKVGVAIVDGKLYVMGFNYSKLDDPENPGTGNWVGWRYPIVNNNPVKTCYGKELVIEFKIQGDPTATGGNSTQTNTANSGVYVPKYKEDGSFDGYEVANSYEIPDADIPINLVIKKYGLKHGESATIQIYWAPQKDKSDPNNYDSKTGKLKPDLDIVWDGASADNHKGWGNFSKVILTNTGEDGAVVTETLLCLDPKYVYLMAEDDWGWSYTQDFDSIDTSQKEFNPFEFTNTKKTNAVRHAEAATLNYFGTGYNYPTNRRIDVKSKQKLSTPASGTKSFSSSFDFGNENSVGQGGNR